jgi:CRISPR-associated protein Cmr5
MSTRQQHYAQVVYGLVTNRLHNNDTFRNRYGALAHRMPMLIRSAGLAQALAFIDARGKEEGEALLNDIAFAALGRADRHLLLQQSREAQLLEYMHLTQQTLDALLWFKRFAQTILNVEAGAEADKS